MVGVLETVDGKALTDEDDSDVVNTIDAEDFAVMLDLYFYKTGKLQVQKKKIKSYNHIVVDEAQDLAPLELSILGKSLMKNASVTIAGDSAQQTDPSTSFRSWDSVLDNLGVKRVKQNHLETTYRSTKPIADFAHKILGDDAPKKAPTSIKDGVPVTFSEFQSDGPMTVVLNEAINDLMVEEPNASCAIICKNSEMAEKIYHKLQDIPKTRLVLDGDFDFTPGIDITEVSQVKGLEFDYVILPDVNHSNYSESSEDRRTLHVAATRAVHQLWVISLANPSSLIEEFINKFSTAVNYFDSFFNNNPLKTLDFHGLNIAILKLGCTVTDLPMLDGS